MANKTAIKRRIGSVKNTRQITKAMELVAASKMRRAQQQALATRTYRKTAESILSRLGTVSDVSSHPLFQRRAVKTRMIVVITSDQGLAGAYNGNILKVLTKLVAQNNSAKIKSEVLAIGRYAGQFASRLEGVSLASAYPMFGDNPSPEQIRPITTEILDRYKKEEIDAVSVIYTEFVSSINQEAKVLELLPTQLEEDKKISDLEVAFFEPSIEEIVEDSVLRLIEVQLWQAALESLASEHSMRMMAMKSASDNANDIIDDLTLEFNTARQAAITQEIAEIVGGAEALS